MKLLLSVGEVSQMVTLSVRQIWRLVAAGQFPKPVHVGHSARWRMAEIEAYVASLAK